MVLTCIVNLLFLWGKLGLAERCSMSGLGFRVYGLGLQDVNFNSPSALFTCSSRLLYRIDAHTHTHTPPISGKRTATLTAVSPSYPRLGVDYTVVQIRTSRACGGIPSTEIKEKVCFMHVEGGGAYAWLIKMHARLWRRAIFRFVWPPRPVMCVRWLCQALRCVAVVLGDPLTSM